MRRTAPILFKHQCVERWSQTKGRKWHTSIKKIFLIVLDGNEVTLGQNINQETVAFSCIILSVTDFLTRLTGNCFKNTINDEQLWTLDCSDSVDLISKTAELRCVRVPLCSCCAWLKLKKKTKRQMLCNICVLSFRWAGGGSSLVHLEAKYS